MTGFLLTLNRSVLYKQYINGKLALRSIQIYMVIKIDIFILNALVIGPSYCSSLISYRKDRGDALSTLLYSVELVSHYYYLEK